MAQHNDVTSERQGTWKDAQGPGSGGGHSEAAWHPEAAAASPGRAAASAGARGGPG
jgi:hypothetical protein